MTGWEPAAEAEVAMLDALRAQDQQLYFRILTRVDLLLPVAGQSPLGWGTWTTGGRTHVLAFTSATAMRACLGDNAGATRRVPYAELAAGWPDHEWWLAVNPGLPIEGYLPAWFVAQLSRGDVRLPGRTMGARARLERVENAVRARAEASGRDVPRASAPAAPAPAAPAPAAPAPAAPSSRPPYPADPATVPFPAAPSVPARTSTPSATESSVPPIPRRPEPANGHLTADGLGRLGPRGADEGAAGWPGPTTVGDFARRPGEVGRPASRAAGDRLAPTPEPAPDNLPGWVSDLRHRSDEPDSFDNSGRSATTNSHSAPPPARSFFEPASGRSARRPSPLDQRERTGERGVPPSRFAQGGQPFPRRRPLNEPVPEDPTRAFSVDPETTQALGPGRPAEPPRPFRPAPPPASAAEATQALPRRQPSPAEAPDADERTQPIPAGDPALAVSAEDLPPSIAEPVSGPPAGRRGFSPIVIEGTIIESRDLTEPAEPPATRPGSGPGPMVAEPYAVPTIPAATSAMANATGPAAYRTEDEGPAAPWAGPAEPTVPLTVDPSRRAGESRSEPAEPLFGGSGTPDRSRFEPAGPGTEPRYAPAASTEARTDPSFAPAASTAYPAAPPAWSARMAGAADPGGGRPAGSTDAGPASWEEAVPVADAGPAREDSRPAAADFVPANEVEEELLGAAGSGSTDGFLSTLLLARVLLPVAADSAAGSRPGDPGFVWHTEQLDGGTYVVVYTSPERLADRAERPVDTVRVKFVQLIRRWPDESWSFAVNPGTPVGATYPGEQVLALANWAAEVGLGDDPEGEPEPPAAEPTAATESRPTPPPVDPTRPVTMQKAIAPSQLAYYLERGYDRVSGFVHRANELAHLSTPAELFDALGLGHPGSPFSGDAEEIYVLRWPAYRPSLYRIPYGGQNEAAMRAMEGWVIERPPFRGNGFAPGESSDVVAEFKVDSARLPHGAQLWRIGADRTERVVAILDTDALLWRQVDAP
ncbi:SseB family protein [Micromonospora yasonensis]|uniref:SseB family protein n=1 Tax=Micromonospora yasonensis TaxID=1128667 RepID=UPI002230E451|nr:SseB family protein [Micromonospora yasonensis]MCW3838865.1 SseB family protein [Micromonospora yasonensis]